MQIDLTSLSTWLTIIGTILTAMGGCYVPIRAILNNSTKNRKRQAAAILQDAKENDALIKLHLETRIHDLETKLHIIEESVQKDMAHLKETYNTEIRFLGQKIEELRGEVHNQHGQLVQLLTKMIGKE